MNRWKKNILYVLFIIAFLNGCPGGMGKSNTPGRDKTPEAMVLVPAGRFIMGSDKDDESGSGGMMGTRKPLFQDEHPKRNVHLKSFYIDKFEVTNAEYRKFTDSGEGEPPFTWDDGIFPSGRETYPVHGVTWFQAYNYCDWAGKRLPSEAEWEKSARGPDGLEFPWGNEFDTQNASLANIGNQKVSDLYPVGSFERGKSLYGVYDLVGNVWEWTSNWYRAYPGSNERLPGFGEKDRVLRGGGWGGGQGHYAIAHFFRSAHRFHAKPYVSYVDVGFRCASF